MVAPNYATARSQLAKQMGLGQQRRRRWPSLIVVAHLEHTYSAPHGAAVAWPGEPQGVRELLARVYGWVAEGFNTGDLKEANGLLEERRELGNE